MEYDSPSEPWGSWPLPPPGIEWGEPLETVAVGNDPPPAPPPPPPPKRPRYAIYGPPLLIAAGALLAAAIVTGALTHRAHQPLLSERFPVPAGGTPTDPTSAAIAAKVEPGVVDVTSNGLDSTSSAGTGMVISSTGLVLTNNHVIEGGTKISVQIDGQGRSYTAKVLGTDPTDDVALLQLDGASGLKTVPLGDSSRVRVGDSVVAMGNALNLAGPPTVTSGRITALDQSITARDPGSDPEDLTGLIQTDALLRPGDSGGPLINAAGQVIGMDTAGSGGGGRRRFQTAGTEGYAVPINKAKSIADQIKAGKAGGNIHIGLPAFLGVELGNGPGAVLTGVVPNTPAVGAGLHAGDTIVSLGGATIGSPDDVTAALSGRHPGDKVELAWLDSGGASRHASVQLASGPAD